MQPYQEASKEINRQGQAPKRALGSAVKTGASLAIGGPLATRILPLLNEFIPGETMRKGLAKLDPRIGKFVESAINNGFGLDEVRTYIKDKFEEPEEEKQEDPEHPNVTQAKDLETNYPHIIEALMRTIQNGQKPEAAAAILKNHSQFSKDIKKIEKDSGKNFVDLILELLGPQNPQDQGNIQRQPPGQQQQMSQQNAPMPDQNQQQPQGGVDPQLMQLLQNIQSGIKNMRGKGG